MKWNRGRQKDSYVIKLSVTDCYKILHGHNKKLSKNLLGIIKDYRQMDEEFKKINGRSFNSSL